MHMHFKAFHLTFIRYFGDSPSILKDHKKQCVSFTLFLMNFEHIKRSGFSVYVDVDNLICPQFAFGLFTRNSDSDGESYEITIYFCTEIFVKSFVKIDNFIVK